MTTEKLIAVIGGSGFIGRHVVQALARDGYRVRVGVRRVDRAAFLKPMGVPGQIMPVQVNVRYPESIAQAVDGADVVINLVGILQDNGKQTFESVQSQGAENVATVCAEHGVQRFIHISAIGADKQSPSRYARSKAQGEDAVLSSYPNAAILRPSIVVGLRMTSLIVLRQWRA